MKNNPELCPFSKPILGKWCSCPHAKLADRCSGKMSCTRQDDLKASCHELDQAFKTNTRFILGMVNDNDELTHAQLMKIRCGGLSGMKRVLGINTGYAVNICEVIELTRTNYKAIENFPYNEIVQDIKIFRHRK